jgi:uncharacterized protein with ParB-like and HNH nuclease domain
MQNGKSTIKDVFDGDKIFTVPKYQRAYAWDEKNLVDFLDDLKNQIETKKYFLGTFLFHERGRRGDYELIDIVDGQQRLTTFSIFIKVIIDCLRKYNSDVVSNKSVRKYIRDDDTFKFELSNDDNLFLHTYILGDDSGRNPKIETPSQNKLFFAKTFFQENLTPIQKPDLESLFEKATTSEVLLYVVQDISSATQIFELLNDRGKKLTDLESIKSFLMYMVGVAQENSDQSITDIQDGFSAIYRIIEKNEINANDALRYHTIAFEKSTVNDYESPKDFIKKKINKIIKKENKEILVSKVVLAYVSRLKESFQLYAELKMNSTNIESLDDLQMIGRVAPFYPLMMKIKKDSPDKLDELIKHISKFTFRATLIGLRSNGESDLYRSIRDGEDILAAVKSITVNNRWNINNRSKEVLDYNNFYEWVNNNVVKYILFKYENKLRSDKGYPLLSKKDYFSIDVREKLNIEHITAQQSKELNLTDDFKENYIHALGNLVIDSTASNSRKSNNPPKSKQKEFVAAPLMSQNEINQSNTNWKKLSEIKTFIKTRDSKLKKFISENWGI